jgi:arylsulfatase
VEQENMLDAPARLATRRLINLTVDPHEREPFNYPHLHSWVSVHFNRLIKQFQASLRDEPLIPLGAPLDHVPRPEGPPR